MDAFFDVVAYLDDKNIEYKTSGKNIGEGWIGMSCLWCPDSGTHLGVNLATTVVSCFRCGAKGNGITLIAEIEKCSKGSAFAISRKYANLNLEISFKRKVEYHVESVGMSSLSKKLDSAAIGYLEKRNFDAQLLQRKYDLYYGGVIGDFKFRIVAPVRLNGNIVSLVGRDITDKSDLRYKTLSVAKSKIPIKSTLYNIDSVDRDAVVVEGIFDCWRIGDSCVATLGTKFTSEQILLLRGMRNVFILFDSDASHQAEKLSMNLQGIVQHVEIIVLDHGDPAEMKDHDVRALRRELRI